jgi:hypothetical protein
MPVDRGLHRSARLIAGGWVFRLGVVVAPLAQLIGVALELRVDFGRALVQVPWRGAIVVMPGGPPSNFRCPGCGAAYKLVRVVKQESEVEDRLLFCINCDQPLSAKDDGFVLKYFLVDRPKKPIVVRGPV